MQLHAYLNFDGNCAEAFRFYEQHLGGKITTMMTHAEAPNAENMPPEMAQRILHGRIRLAGTEVFASDMPPGVQEPMRSAYLCLSVDSDADAERIYHALTNPGDVLMAMEETFFAHRFAMVRDQFGVLWMIIHERVPQA